MTDPDKPIRASDQSDPAIPALETNDPSILIHRIPEEDQQFVAEMMDEVKDSSPEVQAYREDEVRTFIAEVALSEQVRAQAQKDIEAAKAAAKRGRGLSGESKTEARKVKVDMSRIGWIKEDVVEDLPVEEISTEELAYGFVDLTEKNAATKKSKDSLEDQTTAGGDNQLEKLLEGLKNTSIPILYENIKSGRNLRPVNAGSRRNVDRRIDTDYPSYKIYVQGTNNVGILMLLNDDESGPVFGLAALYDHDDEKLIYRTME